ncbi:uncharacterized protein LOC131075844 [Cryptomeria japonica]|uniref:uncharacterized protein LOC131075844 n=1 Tax=Cryptomeria japonica TaxID=3369 RepID=UPI0027D9FA5B|nr:uncharacterized protein LOC131075844 [Cryptomeria japonica]
MANLNGDESKMAKVLKRQPDWVLQKLRLERDAIQIPKSNKVEEEKGKGNWNNKDRTNNVRNNGGNHGNNGNYGNNGNGNNRNGNNNNGNNGGNGNYQINNYGCKPPMTIERYKKLDLSGIVGYPNQIANDLRSAIPKFTGNGTDSAHRMQENGIGIFLTNALVVENQTTERLKDSNMGDSSSKGKRTVTEVSKSASKKSKGGEGVQKRKLNQDMINQMSSIGAKSRRSKTNLPICDQLEDEFREIGDI